MKPFIIAVGSKVVRLYGIGMLVYARTPIFAGFTLLSYNRAPYLFITLPPSFYTDEDGYSFSPRALTWVWFYLNALPAPPMPDSIEERADILLYLRAFRIPLSSVVMRWCAREIRAGLGVDIPAMGTGAETCNDALSGGELRSFTGAGGEALTIRAGRAHTMRRRIAGQYYCREGQRRTVVTVHSNHGQPACPRSEDGIEALSPTSPVDTFPGLVCEEAHNRATLGGRVMYRSASGGTLIPIELNPEDVPTPANPIDKQAPSEAMAYLIETIAQIPLGYQHDPFYVMNSKVLSLVYDGADFAFGPSKVPLYGCWPVVASRANIDGGNHLLPEEPNLNTVALMYVWYYLNGLENQSDHSVNVDINDIDTWLAGWRYITEMKVRWNNLFISSYLDKASRPPLLNGDTKIIIRGVLQGIPEEKRGGIEIFSSGKELVLDTI